MTSDPILLEETHAGVRCLRMNRPETRNALSNDLIRALIRGLDSASSDEDVRVVALTGEGGAFCSGADLSPRKPGDPPPDSLEATADLVVELVQTMRVGCEKPVIAGIDGIAIGAGLSLAMCADMRMASSRARFHPGYARIGTSPDAGLTWTLPAVLGHERAMRFFLRPMMHDADAMHRRTSRAGESPALRLPSVDPQRRCGCERRYGGGHQCDRTAKRKRWYGIQRQ